MHLSKLVLNTKQPQVRGDLDDLYELHRSLSNCFLFHEESGPGRILFRLEDSSTLLVVSEQRPDWQKLPPGYLLKEFPILDYANQSLIEGEQYYFRLRANPTVRESAGKGQRGKRRGLCTIEEQEAWIKRKGEKKGFSLLSLSVRPEGLTELKGTKIQLNSVLYEGALKVDDPKQLKEALFKGLGSGKSFGFGLLSIARG